MLCLALHPQCSQRVREARGSATAQAIKQASKQASKHAHTLACIMPVTHSQEVQQQQQASMRTHWHVLMGPSASVIKTWCFAYVIMRVGAEFLLHTRDPLKAALVFGGYVAE
jgi:hypothetical protein